MTEVTEEQKQKRRERQRQYYQRNKQKMKEKAKERYRNNDYYVEYRLNNKERNNERAKEWARNNPERAKERARQWRIDNPIRFLYMQIKHRAKNNNIEFDLIVEDLNIPTVCPVLGVPLEFRGDDINNSPSVDRIDPNKGYTSDNISIMSYRANRIKNDASISELKRLVEFLETLE